MRIYFNAFLIFCLCLWLIPLGRFIDKSKEAKVCGGQRAVCLCSTNMVKTSSHAGKIELTRSATSSSEKAPSSGANHDYLLPARTLILPSAGTYAAKESTLTYALLLIKSIEHIPNA